MANQFHRGITIGTSLESASQLHALIEQATILPATITDQVESSGVSATDYILLYSASAAALRKIQIGSLVFSAGDIIPTAAVSVTGSGWLLCDGQQYLQSAYPTLFAAIGAGNPYGAADSGYFRVPDLRGRTMAGLDTIVAGAYAERLTNAGTGNPGLNSKTLGAVGGFDRQTLTSAQIPAHAHPITWAHTNYAWGESHTNAGSTGGSTTMLTGLSTSAAPTATGSNAGGGSAFPTQPPSIVLNFKIKT